MTKAELRHLVWEHYGVRVDHLATKEHMEDLLMLRVRETPGNRVTYMRKRLIAYVAQHKDRLSLFCVGDCYQHEDAIVLNCYAQLKEAQRGEREGT